MNKLFIFSLCLLFPLTARAQANSGSQPFAISITADNAEVKAGSNVCVQVSLANNSSQDLDLSGGADGYTNLDPNYRFEVRDQSGNLLQQKVYPHPELFRPRLYNYTLKPSETYSQDQCPSALYDMRKPGQYTIQAFRSASSNTAQGGEIASNIVTVTVVPAAAGGQPPPSTIVIAPLKPSFKAGSDVCVGISFTNSTPQNLNMSYAIVNGVSSEFRFEVHDESGNLLPKKAKQHPDVGSFQGGEGRGLKPNDTEVSGECPSKQYDMSMPGKYTIQAFRSIPNTGEVVSNIVTVTVEP